MTIKLLSTIEFPNQEAAEGFIEDQQALLAKWGGTLTRDAWTEGEEGED